MKVSIITPSYNSKNSITTCITSVLVQDYQDIEHIIVDGKSTDSTVELIKRFEGRITKWISEPDKGIYDAINKGIKIATGDVIGVLNSDDFFADPNVVSRIVKGFNETHVQIIYGDIDFVKSNDLHKVIRHYSSRYFKPWMFRFGFQPAHPSFYTYSTNFEKFGHYRTDLSIAGDFELLLRFILRHEIPYKYVNDTWVKMRIGGVSTSGINSVIKLNGEILQACRVNQVYTNLPLIYLKYLIKWWGFIFKRK